MILVVLAMLLIMAVSYTIFARDDWSDIFNALAIVTTIVTTVFILLGGIIAIVNATDYQKESVTHDVQLRYDGLVYQASVIKTNEKVKKNLLDDIEEWNSYIYRMQKLENNFWVGIFVPDVYHRFDPISFNVVKGE